jgi:uncharacterized protein (DUF58 family)
MASVKDLWPWLAGVIIIAGIAAQNAALVALGFALALACGVALLWSRWSLRRLFYERIVPEDHAFPDESIDVTLRITNRKPLPLPWIEVRDTFPEAMTGEGQREGLRSRGQPNQLSMEWRTSAGAYDKISRNYTLRAPERGVYELGPANIRTGDPFGLFPEEREGVHNNRITVYPRIVDLEEQVIPSRRPFGEVAGGLRIFEDPSRIAGLRDYEPGDSFRRVDWNATARAGKLQSRVYDPTSSHHLLICLNTATLTPAWAGFIPELFEGSITIAASLALQAQDQRYALGLVASSSVLDGDRAIRIPPGRRPEQLIRVLEALATITPYVLEPLSRILDREEHSMSVGTTLAIVTPIMPEDLVLTLQRLRRRGYRLIVFSPSGNRWGSELDGIEVRHLTWPDVHSSSFERPAEAPA